MRRVRPVRPPERWCRRLRAALRKRVTGSLNLHSSAAIAAGIAAALHKWLLDDNVACAAPCSDDNTDLQCRHRRHLECRDTLARKKPERIPTREPSYD